MTAAVPLRKVRWPKTYRIIRSIYPPIDLFEDIADPEDWELLVSAESKTNPRVQDQVGNLSLVPPDRCVSGPGASLLMAPFVHCSTDRPGRFSDGSFGIYYAADSEEVAIREVAYHHEVTMAQTSQDPGWVSDFRVLLGHVDARFHNVESIPGVLDPVDYSVGQKIGAELRDNGSDGIVYPSVRAPSGHCIAVFWPNVLPIPDQGDHHCFHWDGKRVDRVRNLRTKTIFAL